MRQIRNMNATQRREYRKLLRDRRFVHKFRNALNILQREGCKISGWTKVPFEYYTIEKDQFGKFITVKK